MDVVVSTCCCTMPRGQQDAGTRPLQADRQRADTGTVDSVGACPACAGQACRRGPGWPGAVAAGSGWTAALLAGMVAELDPSLPRSAWAAGLLLAGGAGLLATLRMATTHTAAGAGRAAAPPVERPGCGEPRHELLDAVTALQSRLALTGDGGGAALVLLDLDVVTGRSAAQQPALDEGAGAAVLAGLQAVVRDGDLVCRLRDTEFALLVQGLAGPADGTALAGRAALAAAGTLGRAGSAPAVGLRSLVSDLDPTTALRDADAALHASRREGRGRPHLWAPPGDAAADEQLALAEDLSQALREGQLRLAYQPVVDSATLRVRGIEVLARWRHPLRGDVPPDQFVRCAERAGLMGELTRWVLRTSCAQAATWPAAPDGDHVNLAVNLSAAQLGDLRVVGDLRDALRASGLPPDRVVLEVTETAEVVDLDCARSTLEALVALGVALALDDFCTGYSSLSHVLVLPFHILKVDRSFVVAAAQGDDRAVATIAAVGALARSLAVDVVAEGVEDVAQLEALRALGCGYAQGFGLSRPLQDGVVADALSHQGGDGWVLRPAQPSSGPPAPTTGSASVVGG